MVVVWVIVAGIAAGLTSFALMYLTNRNKVDVSVGVDSRGQDAGLRGDDAESTLGLGGETFFFAV